MALKLQELECGCNIGVAELAAHMGTIPYVVICSLSKRVVRRYVEGATAV